MKAYLEYLSACFSRNTKSFLVFMFLFFLTSAAYSFSFTETFKNSTAPGWTFYQEGPSPGPRLTAGALATAEDPETAGTLLDTAGNGWLRLATTTGQQANSVVFDTVIPSLNSTVQVEFETAMWGAGGIGAADGISVFLFDASQTFTPGASGGSLGYAQEIAASGAEADQAGVPGGYIGVALDNFGNFSSPTEGRIGGPGQNPNSISVRGPGELTAGGPLDGQWYSGYEYLAGTGDTDPALTFDMDFPTATSRPDTSGVNKRQFRITLDNNDLLTVEAKVGAAGSYSTVLSVDYSSFVRPDGLRIGFSAGTGGGQQVLEVRGLEVETVNSSTTWEWDDGLASDEWRNSTAVNWNPNSNPTSVSGFTPTVIFGDIPTTDETITVRDGDKTVREVFFSGPNSYTLNPNNNEALIFDDGAAGGGSIIGIYNNSLGNADHTINMDIEMLNDLDINHFVSQTFNIGGNIDAGSNDLTVNTTGTVNITGNIDTNNAGNLIKKGDGLLTVSSDNASNFRGTTIIEDGELRISHRRALGGGDAVVVEDGGTFSLTGSIDPNNPLSLAGMGHNMQGALYNYDGENIYKGAGITLTDDASIGVRNANDRLQINTTISGAFDLKKVGPGTLQLNRENTFSGDMIVEEGTLRLNANSGEALKNVSGLIIEDGGTVVWNKDNQVNDAAGVTLAGGTLDINGHSETMNSLTLTANSTINMGNGGTLNFIDAIYTTGTLTIAEWTQGSDAIIFSNTVPQSFLDNVYWADLGITGAIQLPSGEIIPIPIPEPSTYFMGIIGLLLSGYHFFKRKLVKAFTKIFF